MFLLEIVRKQGDRYYIYSHETNKKLGRKIGYATANEAVAGLLGLVSRGRFHGLSSKIKHAQVKAYKKRHNL